MSIVVNSIQTGIKSGCCPHGLPQGSCPICSGMGGSSQKQLTADFSAKPGEMSWNECAAIGAFLKSLKNAQMARESDYQNRLINMAMFQDNMAKMAKNLQEFINNMSRITLGKPIALATQNVILPMIKFLKDLPVNFLKLSINIQLKLADISDKLAAIYGEMKASVDKKLSKLTKNIKKKFKFIFEIFLIDNEDGDNEIISEFEKQLERLKTLVKSLDIKFIKNIREKSKEGNYCDEN